MSSGTKWDSEESTRASRCLWRLRLAALWAMPETDGQTDENQAECPSVGEWLNSYTARNMWQFKNEEIKEI